MIAGEDENFMRIALREAEEGARRGDFPVGAVLTIDGKFIGKGSNSNYTNKSWAQHAEASLIIEFDHAIQENKKDGKRIEIYTTLEPCLMCLGTCFLNRINRIVYACQDPNGGATSLDVKSLPDWYGRKWPAIEGGVLKEESYQILADYMKGREKWGRVLTVFESMHK
jgi:tRNA(adenine34) deaminase